MIDIPDGLLLRLYRHTYSEATSYFRDPIGHAIWEEIKDLDGGAFREVVDELEADNARQYEAEVARSIADKEAAELSRHSSNDHYPLCPRFKDPLSHSGCECDDERIWDDLQPPFDGE